MKQIDLIAFAVAGNGRARVRITGNSMLPLLRDGMIAEVEALRGRPRTGDVLIYDMGKGPIAHRVLSCLSDERFVLCGDAVPHDIEHVRANSVVGRAVRIHESDAPEAAVVSAWRLRLGGMLMVYTRAPRATVARFKTLLRHGRKLATRQRPFRAMLLALRAFSRGETAAGLAALTPVSLDALYTAIARHGTAGHLLRILEQAKRDGYPVNETLFAGLRSSRWHSALHADVVLARAQEVHDVLNGVGIEPIYLKGAARLLAREKDADMHFSGDVDLIVPLESADVAVDALRANGFDHHVSAIEQRFYRRYVQHRSPLWKSSDAAVPVEVHTQLVLPGSVSQRFFYANLRMRSVLVDSQIGCARVLDAVATAVHLAYHGRDFRRLRDAGLLALKLSALNAEQRMDFDAILACEKRDGFRLRALAKLAADWNGENVRWTKAERTWLSWVEFREDLPPVFRQRTPLLEGIYGRCLPPYQGMRHVGTVAYAWIYNFLALPFMLAFFVQDQRKSKEATIG